MATYPSPYSYLRSTSGGKTAPAAQKVQSVDKNRVASVPKTVSVPTTFTVTT